MDTVTFTASRREAKKYVNLLNKEIPEIQAEYNVDFSWQREGRYWKRDWYGIVKFIPDNGYDTEKVRSFCESYDSRKKEEKKQKIEKKIEQNKDNIAEAIYVINKEAKRLRDVKLRAIDSVYGDDGYNSPLGHWRIHSKNEEIENMYSLKERVLKKLIESRGIIPVGYHEFDDMNRDMYVVDGYEFHMNTCTSAVHLGYIEDHIPSEKKKGTMSIDTAYRVLYRFLK